MLQVLMSIELAVHQVEHSKAYPNPANLAVYLSGIRSDRKALP